MQRLIIPRGPRDSLAEVVSPVAEKASYSLGIDFADSSFSDIDSVARCLTFPLGFTSWDDDDYGNASGDSIDPLFNTKLPQTAKGNWVGASASAHRNGNKRTVTVDVNVLIFGMSHLIIYQTFLTLLPQKSLSTEFAWVGRLVSSQLTLRLLSLKR